MKTLYIYGYLDMQYIKVSQCQIIICVMKLFFLIFSCNSGWQLGRNAPASQDCDSKRTEESHLGSSVSPSVRGYPQDQTFGIPIQWTTVPSESVIRCSQFVCYLRNSEYSGGVVIIQRIYVTFQSYKLHIFFSKFAYIWTILYTCLIGGARIVA